MLQSRAVSRLVGAARPLVFQSSRRLTSLVQQATTRYLTTGLEKNRVFKKKPSPVFFLVFCFFVFVLFVHKNLFQREKFVLFSLKIKNFEKP
jgi:hypothetical protein